MSGSGERLSRRERTSPDPRDSLVVMAAKMESRGRIEGAAKEILFTGVGKVNAAVGLTRKLAEKASKPKLVLNLGTAGSHRFPLGALVACGRFFQSDMDATPLNFRPYQTPFESGIALESRVRVANFPVADLYSADRFVTDASLGFPLIDMEGFALAKACENFGVPFLAVKYVSDSADEDSVAWEETLDKASAGLRDFLGDFLDGGYPFSVIEKRGGRDPE